MTPPPPSPKSTIHATGRSSERRRRDPNRPNSLREVIPLYLDHVERQVAKKAVDRTTLVARRSLLAHASLVDETGQPIILDLPLRGSPDEILQAEDVLRWYDALEVPGRDGKPSAIVSYRAHTELRSCLAWARKTGLCVHNAASNLGIQLAPAAPGQPIDPIDLARLWDQLDLIAGERRAWALEHGEPLFFADQPVWIIKLVMLAGTRLCEITRLQRAWLNRSCTEAIVPRSKNRRQRPITFEAHAAAILRQQMDEAAAYSRVYVFPSAYDPMTKSMCTRTPLRVFHEAARRVGLTGRTPHDLRYSFAQSLQLLGKSLFTIQRCMGHENLDMTLHYLKASRDPGVRAAVADHENSFRGQPYGQP